MQIEEFIKSKKHEINTLIEIGAHFGTDTLKFREILPHARIIVFEPDPRNLEVIKKNWGNNNVAELYELAASDYNGKTEFHLSSGNCHWCGDKILTDNEWSASNSIKKPKGHTSLHKWVKFEKKIEVDCVKLDDFEPLKNISIDFIWADVQGAEDLVFKGSKEILKKTKYVYTEFNEEELYENQLNLKGILDLFGNDWEILHLYKDDVLLRNIKLT